MNSPQRVLVTGATGFVGRLLCLRLRRDGHQVVAWVRSAARARSILGAEPELIEVASGDAPLKHELSRCDAVIHLAGEGLFDRRWSKTRKQVLRESRVGLTRRLVDGLVAAAPRPRTLISASAIGWYGARDERVLDEGSSPGAGFLAELCKEWEDAASRARDHGLRVANVRIGLVLGSDGGALGRMLPLFQLGLGGRLASGRQWMSWIHIDDLVELLALAVTDERFEGVFNATAPEPVTNREFTATLARVVRRPALFPAPRFPLRAVLGEAADVLCTGQRVLPKHALALGFEHRFNTLESALRDLIDTSRACEIGAVTNVPESDYLTRRRPHFELRQSTFIAAPLEEVFGFFSKSANLGAITPPSMSFAIQTPAPIAMRRGTLIDYRIRVGPLPLRWRTRIEDWNEGERFVDSQLRGPYRSWWHEHSFEARDGGTWMADRVLFAAPLGALGRPFARFLVLPKLRGIFAYRARAIALRFGPADSHSADTKKPTAACTTVGQGVAGQNLTGPTKLGERAVIAAAGEHGAKSRR